MSRTLILTRHAKSDWGDPMQPDKARPLNKRGRRDAPRVAAWLSAQDHVPDQAFISSAARTAETWSLMTATFETTTSRFFDQLYHADASEILATLTRATAATVMLIGHNPGIAEAANRFLQHAPDHPRFFDYPTCATLICRFDIADWADLHWGMGHAVGFATPHEL